MGGNNLLIRVLQRHAKLYHARVDVPGRKDLNYVFPVLHEAAVDESRAMRSHEYRCPAVDCDLVPEAVLTEIYAMKAVSFDERMNFLVVDDSASVVGVRPSINPDSFGR